MVGTDETIAGVEVTVLGLLRKVSAIESGTMVGLGSALSLLVVVFQAKNDFFDEGAPSDHKEPFAWQTRTRSL